MYHNQQPTDELSSTKTGNLEKNNHRSTMDEKESGEKKGFAHILQHLLLFLMIFYSAQSTLG